MTQTELAHKVGASTTSICRYENGEREPNMEMLCRLADELGCTVDELIRGTPEERERGGMDTEEPMNYPGANIPEQTVTAAEAAKYLGTSRQAVVTMAKNGQLPVKHYFSGNRLHVMKDSLMKFCDKR